ncbi:RNA 3'-phosphate cyclase [Candidatus Woesearchaeota archaeon]|nr:RNA 3'-phosphate cyclase [Candidatus Woesearchaeota archaeon]
MEEYLVLDGSYGEGGGQILRTALAFSALSGSPIIVENIRHNRPKTGLAAQHLATVEAYRLLCGAEIEGAAIGSERLVFRPGRMRKGSYEFAIGTAGSVTLLLQSLLIPAIAICAQDTKARRGFRFTVTGGTDVAWSMPADYLANVLVPHLRRWAEVDIVIERRGFFPKGGGRVVATVRPRRHGPEEASQEPRPLRLDRTDLHLHAIRGRVVAELSLASGEVAERAARALRHSLCYGCPVSVDIQYAEAASPGVVATAWAVLSASDDDADHLDPIVVGADALGERGVPGEQVGSACADTLKEAIDAGTATDVFLADNLLPYLALFGGAYTVPRMTDHLRSNRYVIGQFLGDVFSVDEQNKRIAASAPPLLTGAARGPGRS